MTRLDPYLLIAEQTEFVDYLADFDAANTWFDVILELAGVCSEAKLRAAAPSGLLLNAAHLQDGSRFVTARMPADFLVQLLQSGLVAGVELAEPLCHQRTSWPKDGGRGKVLPAVAVELVQRGSDTLAAIIDDGCPFAHAEFRRAGTLETRVMTIWDLDPKPELAFAGSGAPPGFYRGREVPRAVLAQWIANHPQGNRVDETGCYQEAGYTPMAGELTHGSHLLGRLAGVSYTRKGNGPDAAAQCDLAFVQLPRRAIEAPDAGSMHAHILDGLRYLRRFAERNGYQRCVVTCAKGSLLGPHDGSSLFERALDAFLAESGIPFEFVFAAGNSHEDPVHALLRPLQGAPAFVDWMLPADNEAATFAELWLDEWADQVQITVSVRGVEHVLQEGAVQSWDSWLTALRKDGQIVLRASPTRVSDGSTPAVPGRVGIEAAVIGASHATPTIHGYVCWGGRNLGTPRETRQARWRVPADSDNTTVIGDGTLLGDGCGSSRSLRLVGGYVGGTDPSRFRRADYSSTGPTRGGRVGPDFVALSEENQATRGVLGPGTRSGITVRVWGTSVAAPQAARAIVNGEPLPTPAPGSPQKAEIGGGFLR